MDQEHFLVKVRRFLPLLAAGQILSAQMMLLPNKRPQPELFWDDNRLSILDGHDLRLLTENPLNGRFDAIEAPPGCLGLSFWRGNAAAMRMADKQFFFSEWIGPGKWFDHPIAFNPSREWGVPFRMYESEYPDSFFGINLDAGFVKDGEASCCAWYRKREDGKLQLESLVNLAWEEKPLFLGSSTDRKTGPVEISPPLKGLVPFLDHPIRVPGAFIVVSWRAGILWVIRDGMDSPSQVIDLIGIDRSLIRGESPFPSVILGIQPKKDGKVLIAHRDPKAIRALSPRPPAKAASNDESSALAGGPPQPPEFPRIVWKVLDPMRGTLEDCGESMPANAPKSLPSEEAQWLFRFGFDPQGRLVYPWRHPASPQGRGTEAQE
ncbi:MAG: hypothetical protein HY014_09410 [Acidobacteria bacterium]|nr:hypothetical protein [Acidobacteriota bacterium]MBI3488372.1 hypothetical protein [Acidobacteriota bacterium]